MMKLDRRNFLSLVAGAAGGFILTPINWKLMDDLAIWTQNWSWTPVVKGGANAYANTTCLICPGGCGLKVRLIDGQRAVGLSGNDNNPINRGGLCAWGAAGLQYQYMEENRVPGPMRRNPTVSVWESITWEEAFEILAQKLQESAAAPQRVALLNGRKRSTINRVLKQFMTAYGSPNYLEMPDGSDVQEMASQMAVGEGLRYGFDLERAEVILSVGAAVLEGWGSPVRMQRAFELWRGDPENGRAKIIQVDPRASLTASKADLWLPATPGSEAALVLGLCQILIQEGRHDASLEQAPGFAAFRSLLLREYTPAKVAEMTGLAQENIQQAAQLFADSKRAVALSGLGQGRLPEPLSLTWAVLALNALKGNLGRPGGVFFTPDLPGPELPPLAQPYLERVDAVESGEVSRVQHLAENVVSGRYPLSLLMLHQANPLFTGPGPGAFREAVEKIPFVVSFSSFWDESTNAADLVLPDHSFLEGWGDVETPLGLPYQTVSLAKPLFAPSYDTMSTGDVILRLAQMLGGSVKEALPFDSYQDVLLSRVAGLVASGPGRAGLKEPPEPQSMVSSPPGWGFTSAKEAFEAMAESGVWYKTGPATNRFSFSFAKTPLARSDRPLEPAGSPDAYPLTLVAFETLRVASGFYANPPFVTKLLGDDFLMRKDVFANINPATAAQAGLKEGDPVVLKTPSAQGKILVHLTEGARPGVIFLPLGLGHLVFDATIKGKGINAAELVNYTEDPASGLAITYLSRVKLVEA